jgi:ABC-2 type transport system ATP-binding protein
MFDEPHLGMDAPARYTFYDELLADYIAHPRTIVVSTHLIDEASSLFERVLIIDHGRLVAHEPADELLSRGAELTGTAAAVDAVTVGRRVVHERSLGATKSAVVLEPIDELRAAATDAGVDLAPLPMQDLFIHLTSAEASR